jgi:hypothetical protein
VSIEIFSSIGYNIINIYEVLNAGEYNKEGDI